MNFTIALLVSSGSSITLFTTLAVRLAAQGHKICFIYDGGDPAALTLLQGKAQQLGGSVVSYDMSDIVIPPPGFVRRIYNRLIKYKFDVNVFHRKNNQAKVTRARVLLKKTKAEFLIVGEDGVAGNAWVIGAARQMGLPVLDCPYEFSTRADFDSSLERKSETQDIVYPSPEELAALVRDYPQWLKTGKFENALLFPYTIIAAREALGLSLKDPWITHGGMAHKLAAESQSTYASYLAEGMDPSKPVLTGSVYGDIVSSGMDSDPAYRTAFDTSRNIVPGRTSILISWPTDYHAGRGQFCEFADYETLTRTVLEYIAQLPDVDVTLSLHPAASPDIRQMVQGIMQITTRDVLSLIPQHDIYVTCGSSTIRWAVASAKPVINYDFYGFKLPDYDACTAVLKPSIFADFQTSLNLLLTKDGYEAAARDQKKLAADWGMLDGQNFARIYGLITRMYQEQRKDNG